MPKFTAVAPANPVPVIVTSVPPPVGPATGLIAVTVGAYANLSKADAADVPPGVVTVTSTMPVPAGLSTVIDVSPRTVKLVAGVSLPNSTEVAPSNPRPVIVTIVPPVAGPPAGFTPLTVGAATYVKSGVLPEVPPGVVTVTPTMAFPAGLSTVIVVLLMTVKFVAGVEPKSTAVASVKPVPVIVTKVPPPSEPAAGLTPETVGPAR